MDFHKNNILTNLSMMLSGRVKSPKQLSVDKCLLRDDIFDFDSENILVLVRELIQEMTVEWETVKRLYEFVRDSIIYDFAPKIEDFSDWQASTILRTKRGFCHQKAILLATLFRSVGIPSALVFQTIIDHVLLDTRYRDMIPDGRLPMHALVAIYFEKKWYRLDATLDSELCIKKGYKIMKVIPGNETLLPETTQDCKPHFTIEKQLGFFDSYPVELLHTLLKHKANWDRWRKFVKREQITM
ncbi:MAG: transglutaminase domain-containing protein [Candidatus Marinimicrobia bacterium]|nr:transglutaminase domain-containing protein [Candidatus Neomarinimicrobiota bacterium]